jgi:suppressor for copper-sensitivity B
MIFLKSLLGFMLGGTVLWLLWVLNGVAGLPATVAVGAIAAALVVVLSWRRGAFWIRLIGGGALASLALATPVALSQAQQNTLKELPALNWVQFDRGEIARLVSRGQVVFVDVTADWCLTCKANKALVIERDPVLSALGTENVTAMQADWTRPDEGISRYLASFGRFGIPFNAVYGPGAPQGIVLSELLTSSEVMDALKAARGSLKGLSFRQNGKSASKQAR